MTAHFHKVRMKPGKPLLFGTRGDTLRVRPAGQSGQLVRLLRAVRAPGFATAPRSQADPPLFVSLPLADDLPYSTDRPTYHPAIVEPAATGEQVRMVPWHGSPDLKALTAANALVLLPPGNHVHRASQPLPVLRLSP